MQARGVVWVPVYRIGEAVPCADIHPATEVVRLAAGQEVTRVLDVLLHDEEVEADRRRARSTR